MPVKQPFEEVVSRHGPTVLRVRRAVVGATDADDAWSDTFLSALKAYPNLPEDANVEAWLVTIAHRKAIVQTWESSLDTAVLLLCIAKKSSKDSRNSGI